MKLCHVLRACWLLATAGLLIGHNGFHSYSDSSSSEEVRVAPCAYNQIFIPAARAPLACVDGDYPATDSAFMPAPGSFDSSLVLRSPHWTNLQRLQGITALTHDLIIVDSVELRSLAGLESLVSVGGNLALSGSANASLQGLESLRRIDSSLYLVDLENLTSLQGPALDSVGVVWLGLNPQLADLKALVGVQSLGGLRIWGSTALALIENIDPVQSKLTVFSVADQQSLTSIQGFDRIDTIGLLALGQNSQLQSVNAFRKVHFIGTLALQGNPQLSSLEGLCNVDSIFSLTLDAMPGLADLGEFSFGQGIAQLNLYRMPQLVNIPELALWGGLEQLQLHDLEKLRRIDVTPQAHSLTTLIVNDADSLQSIEGLAGQTVLRSLVLTNLPSLQSLELPSGTSVHSITIINTGLCQSAIEAWIQTLPEAYAEVRGNRSCE